MKTSTRCGLLTSAASLLLALSLHGTAHAALMTWSAPTAISGDSDVVNTGTVVGAFNLGGFGVPSTTVNGVTFASFGIPYTSSPSSTTVGNFNLSFDFSESSNTRFGSGSGAFSSLSSAYRTLLQSAAYDANPFSITLTMQGLSVGQDYLFQWWSNNRSGSPATHTTASSGTFVTLNSNPTAATGGSGQYATGTFTANNATQSISFVDFTSPGDRWPTINAFQVRTVAPVPEPGTALFGLACVGVAALRRRRRA